MLRVQKEAGKKPNSLAMINEIKRRDASLQPNGWVALKMCKWLFENPYAAEGTVPVVHRVTPTPELTDPPQGGVLVVVADTTPKSVPVARWRRNHHSARLAMCIHEHKDEYLARDAKPASRQELEAVDRNGVWIKIAATFNNPYFNPGLIQSRVRA